MSKSSSAGAGSRGSGATTKIIGWRTLALLSGGYVVYKMLRESKLLECPVVIRGEDAFYLKQAGKKKEDLSADFKERECKEINFVLMDSSRARYLVRHLYMAIQELGFPSFVALIVYGGVRSYLPPFLRADRLVTNSARTALRCLAIAQLPTMLHVTVARWFGILPSSNSLFISSILGHSSDNLRLRISEFAAAATPPPLPKTRDGAGYDEDDDGQRLNAYVIKRASIWVKGVKIDCVIIGRTECLSRHENNRWMLFSGGNGELYEMLAFTGYRRSVLKLLDAFDTCGIMFNYPGVAASHAFPTRELIRSAYLGVLSFVEQQLKATHIYLYGHSIGCGVQALALAHHRFKPGIKYCVIKSRTFTSLSATAAHMLVPTIESPPIVEEDKNFVRSPSPFPQGRGSPPSAGAVLMQGLNSVVNLNTLRLGVSSMLRLAHWEMDNVASVLSSSSSSSSSSANPKNNNNNNDKRQHVLGESKGKGEGGDGKRKQDAKTGVAARSMVIPVVVLQTVQYEIESPESARRVLGARWRLLGIEDPESLTIARKMEERERKKHQRNKMMMKKKKRKKKKKKRKKEKSPKKSATPVRGGEIKSSPHKTKEKTTVRDTQARGGGDGGDIAGTQKKQHGEEAAAAALNDDDDDDDVLEEGILGDDWEEGEEEEEIEGEEGDDDIIGLHDQQHEEEEGGDEKTAEIDSPLLARIPKYPPLVPLIPGDAFSSKIAVFDGVIPREACLGGALVDNGHDGKLLSSSLPAADNNAAGGSNVLVLGVREWHNQALKTHVIESLATAVELWERKVHAAGNGSSSSSDSQ